jgi:disintegrin and metalloproteinase domain-containing protein 17
MKHNMICNLKLVIIGCLIMPVIYIVSAELDKVLHNFETLHHEAFKHHIKKRHLYVRDPEERQVEYDSFGRHFKLVLRKSSNILASDFKVTAIGADNVERVVDITPAIYHGYIDDEPDTSYVSAYWEGDNSLMATITTQSDVFAIEPSWRHLPNASDDSMISYRMSDLDMEADLGSNFCGYVNEGLGDSNYTSLLQKEDESNKDSGSRRKRSSSCTPSKSRPVCKLLLVADYRFFQGMGQSNLGKTTSYLIGLVDRVNSIYKVTSFGDCGTGFGFEIQQIRIFQQPSDGGTYGSFNMQKDTWDTGELLEMFSRDPTYKDFCLAHLFTQIPFSNGVLGLAYIGGSRVYSIGGVCSPPYYKGGFQLFLNTGWSSAVSKSNRLLLTLESTLVTAHELGHNWGSEHDPDTTECGPSTSGGGKYIMYMYSVSGMDTNNQLFSPCSRRLMGAVLEAKAESCFKQSVGGFCGNMRVEGDEQCDAGPSDPCCTSTCYLRPGAVCSDVNDVCCRNCAYAPSGTLCESAQGGSVCYGNAACTGTSKVCPRPPTLPDGSVCLLGNCRNGTCLAPCEYNNQSSCVCDTLADACKWCCRDPKALNSSQCVPFKDLTLPEGMPCVQGYCDNKGTCTKSIRDASPRPWYIIENLTVNKLVQFMRSNIVGTVIVLSLIIWIPLCCIISFVDYMHKKNKTALVAWTSIENEQFVDKTNTRVKINEARQTLRRLPYGTYGDHGDQFSLLGH